MQRSPGLTWLSIPSFEEGDGIKPTLHLQWYAPGGSNGLINVLSQCDPTEAPHLFWRSQMLAVNKTITFYYADSRCDINWLFAFDGEVWEMLRSRQNKNIHVPLKKKWYSTPARIYSPPLIRTSPILQWNTRSRVFFHYHLLNGYRHHSEPWD